MEPCSENAEPSDLTFPKWHSEQVASGPQPYYQDDYVTIYHGDFHDFREVVSKCTSVITDPPYGETSLVWDRWPGGWPDAMPGSSLWCFASMRTLLTRSREFSTWNFAQDLVWGKHNGSSFHADRFRRVHEHITHWYRGQWGTLRHEVPVALDATRRTTRRKQRPAHMGEIAGSPYVSEDGGPRLMRSVFYARSEHGYALHPTQKPLAIVLPLIEYSVALGETVLDPFAGSGTTLVAAKSSGRRAIGIEIDERYCEVAARRCAQEYLPLFGNDRV